MNIRGAYSYSVSFPTYKRNLAVISNADIKYLTDYDKYQLIKLFNSVPLLLFKNQKINPVEYYEFCKLFDDKHTNDTIHPLAIRFSPALKTHMTVLIAILKIRFTI